MTKCPYHDEAGSAVVELALGAPLLALLIWLVVWAGTGGQTPGEVSVAAHDAARLASTVRDPGQRPGVAGGLVDRALNGTACTSWTVTTTSTSAAVAVTVDCTLDTPQMAGLQLDARTVTVTGRASLDPFVQGRP